MTRMSPGRNGSAARAAPPARMRAETRVRERTGGASAASYFVPVAAVSTADPRNLSLADLNADGRLDAITANPGNGSITFYLQNTAGQLIPQQFIGGTTPVIPGSVPRGVGVGDFNRDGFLDLANLQNGADLLNLHLQTSGAAFLPTYRVQPGLPTDQQPVFVEVRDLNLDGRADAAVSCSLANRLRVFLQR